MVIEKYGIMEGMVRVTYADKSIDDHIIISILDTDALGKGIVKATGDKIKIPKVKPQHNKSWSTFFDLISESDAREIAASKNPPYALDVLLGHANELHYKPTPTTTYLGKKVEHIAHIMKLTFNKEPCDLSTLTSIRYDRETPSSALPDSYAQAQDKSPADTWQSAKQAVPRSASEPLDDYRMRIGNTTFMIPPLAIDVSTLATIERQQALRVNGSIKSGTGHANVRVEMSLYFNDISDINDEDNGLRALIAQFKRTPFLPVVNKYLNEVHNIHALTLSNMIVTTVPGFPNAIQAKLVAYKFNHLAYVPSAPSLDAIIDWDLFRWYYKRNLIHEYGADGKPTGRTGRLRPIPSDGMTNDVVLRYIPINVLEELRRNTHKKAKEIQAEMAWDCAPIPEIETVPREKKPDTTTTIAPTLRDQESDTQADTAPVMSTGMPTAKQDQYIGVPPVEPEYRVYASDQLVERDISTFKLLQEILASIEQSSDVALKCISLNANDRQQYIKTFNATVTQFVNELRYPFAHPRITYKYNSQLFNLLPGTGRDKSEFNALIKADPRFDECTGHIIYVTLFSSVAVEGLPETSYTQEGGYYRVPVVVVNSNDLQLSTDTYNQITNARTRHIIRNLLTHGVLSGANTRPENVLQKIQVDEPNRLTINDVLAYTGNELVGLMVSWPLPEPDKIQVMDAMVAYENLVSQLQLQAHDTPTHQFLGSQDVFIKLTIRTSSDDNVRALRELLAYSMKVSRDYQDVVHSGFISIQHDLANLFGVHNVYIDQFHVRTVPGMPGQYDIEMILLDFDVAQRRIERTGGIIGTTSPGCKFVRIDAMADTHANTIIRGEVGPASTPGEVYHRRKSLTQSGGDQGSGEAGKFMSINEMFKYFEVYPDLELPTWQELAAAGLQTHVRHMAIDPVKDTEAEIACKTVSWNGDLNNTPNGGVYVDPDFYFMGTLQKSDYLRRTMKHGVSPAFIDGQHNIVRRNDDGQWEPADPTLFAELADSNDHLMASVHSAARLRSERDQAWRIAKTYQASQPMGFVGLDTEALVRGDFHDSTDPKGLADRIALCCHPDADVRRKAFPAIPEIVRGPLGRDGTQYQYDLIQFVQGQGVLSRGRAIGALFLYLSGIQQLYPFDIYRYPMRGVVGAPVVGEPVQRCVLGENGDNIWQPYFGVAQLNIVKLQDKFDVVRMVYDGAYNIQCGVKIFDEIANSISDKDIDRFVTKLAGVHGAVVEDKPTGSTIQMAFDSFTKTTTLHEKLGMTHSVKQHEWKYIFASIMYGPLEYTFSEVEQGLLTQGRSNNPRANAAWTLFDELYGTNHGTNWNYAQRFAKLKPLTAAEMMGVVEDSVASQEMLLNVGSSFEGIDEATQMFFNVSQVKGPSVVHQADPEGPFHDYLNTDASGRMLRAFPTFHMMLIDEGRQIRWWKMWDNFYGIGAIADISLHKSRKNIADTCAVMVSNMYKGIGELQSRGADSDIDEAAKNRPWWEFWNPVQGPTDDHLRMRDRLEPRLILSPGSRIHLRLGYGSNAAKMPIVFNGTITEIDVGETVSFVAQGDGIELTNRLPFGDTAASGYCGFGVEPRNLIVGLMTTRSWSKTALSTFFGGGWFRQDENIGIMHFGTVHSPDRWHMSIEEVGENIYPAKLKDDENIEQELREETLINPWSWFSSAAGVHEQNVQVDLHEKSVWDVVQTCAMAIPNYIAAVAPIGFRSTLFYGKANWNYVYDYDSAGARGLNDVHVIKKVKPFQQWHAYDSVNDILDNSIRATARDLYTNVIGTYLAGCTNILGSLPRLFGVETGGAHTATVTAHGDKDIYPQFQRTTQVYTNIRYNPGQGKGLNNLLKDLPESVLNIIPGVGLLRNNTLTEACAFAVAQSAVRDYFKDMYDGELLVMGDPSVKPHDVIYVWDPINMMFGLCEAKEVVHHMSLETGFVTSITPDLCVAVADPNRHKVWGTSGALMSAATALGVLSIPYIGSAVASATVAATGASALTLTPILSALVGCAAAPPVLPFVIGAAVVLASAHVVTNMFKRDVLDSAECVVCNFLSYRGREFSAGILGHKGITLGTNTQVFKNNTINKIATETIGFLGGHIATEVQTHDAIFNANAAALKDIQDRYLETRREELMMEDNVALPPDIRLQQNIETLDLSARQHVAAIFGGSAPKLTNKNFANEEARFEWVISYVLSNEGSTYNAKEDSMYGLMQSSLKAKRLAAGVVVKNLSKDEAKDIYHEDWWRPLGVNGLKNDYIARKVFDTCVNTGERTGIMILQRAILAIKAWDGSTKNFVDGILGPNTLKAANNADPVILLAAIIQQQLIHYDKLIKNNPKLDIYRKGWEARAYKY